MTFNFKSLLPTLSISLPAIITGILIFNENKIEPLTALFSLSGEEKKEESKDKGQEDGHKNGKDEGEKQGIDDGKGDKEGLENKESVGEGETDGKDKKEEGSGEGKNEKAGESNQMLEGTETNGSGENLQLDSADDSETIGPEGREGDVEEKARRIGKGGRKIFASAFSSFFGGEIIEEFD